MTIYFTSDTHYSHKNIIKYTNRPFSSVEEMDEQMRLRWNSVVTDDDIVYHLGDFAFHQDQNETVELINSLKGKEIHLILGNHDKKMKEYVKNKFTSCSSYLEIKVQDPEVDNEQKEQFIVLCHYAFRTWNRSYHGSWNLYGHSHGNLPDDSTARSLDVGVDCWNFTPVSYEQLKERMKLKNYRPSADYKEQ
jgi:calcineurin-like phosphoesterase family protein